MTEQQITHIKNRIGELLPTGKGEVNAARIRQAFEELIDEVAAGGQTGKQFRFEAYTPGTWLVGEFAITADKKKIFTPKVDIANSQTEPSDENQYWQLVFEDSNAGAGTWDELSGKPDAFLPTEHKHSISDIKPVQAPQLTLENGVLGIVCTDKLYTGALFTADALNKLTFTLEVTGAVEGTLGRITIKQTVAGTITITLPANSAGRSVRGNEPGKQLIIYGEANENHYIQFEYVDGTYQFRTNFYNRR